ncbi:MAG TPA: SusD/RagB family nutrient-binding outer membrane lipoprotein [Chitinophagaceae bacterium]|nr:SusD/RagB family nutrient-binding outer membrane lipoprotein [Chitinophagaceae bacterium]
MKLRYFKLVILFAGIVGISSCKKFMDINKDPDRLPDSNSPIAQLLTSAQVNLSFEGGSDIFRYSTLIMQMMSGLASQPNQTYEYSRYNITGTDVNNSWASVHAGGNGTSGTLSDLELIIKQGTTSPYYTGVAKILKAYEYALVVDVWGKMPYSEAQQLTANTQPHYDHDSSIYRNVITLLDAAIVDLNATSSVLTPGTNSVIYTNGGNFTTAKAQWIKLANTLKLRLFLHYSKFNPTYCVQQLTALINSGAAFMASNTDNFSTPFYDVANNRNPISAFEVSRPGYLYADNSMVTRMNAKFDPRRPYYFTSFPYQSIQLPITLSTSAATAAGNVLTFNSTVSTGTPSGPAGVNMVISGTNIPPGTVSTAVTATTITLSNNVTGGGVGAGASIVVSPNAFAGVVNNPAPGAAGNSYSRIHTFLRGIVTAGTTPPFTYSGAAPQRMLTFAEYNFIRAEAALRGAPGVAQTFFTAGITASMQEAGVSAVQIADYLAVNGTLSGSTAQQIQQVIEEKYLALFGVSVEPWTDWRRTGFPALTIPSNALNGVSSVPRTLFYPQSEIDLNPNCPGQKSSTLQTGGPFWDN